MKATVVTVWSTGAFLRLGGGGEAFLPAAGSRLEVGATVDVEVGPAVGPRRYVARLPGADPQPVAPRAGDATGTSEAATQATSGGRVGSAASAPELEDALAELDAMVGLGRVKEELHDLVQGATVRRRKAEAGIEAAKPSYHMVFVGPPGTGKTTVARLAARIFAALGLVERDHLEEVRGTDLVAPYVGHSTRYASDAFERARGGVLFIDEAYALVAEGSAHYGEEVINTLVPLIENHAGDTVVILAGYEDDMRELLDRNEGLASRFPTTIHFESYTDAELMQVFESLASTSGFALGEGAAEAVRAQVAELPRGRGFGNARAIRELFNRCVRNQEARLSAGSSISDRDLRTLTLADVSERPAYVAKHAADGVDEQEARDADVAHALEELDDLVGLAPVKRELRSLVDLATVDRLRRSEGLPTSASTHHLVFAGPPGTGKTTVARIVADVYHGLGIVERGQLVEAGPEDLIGDHQGETAKKTEATFRRAIGGVLFLDEAYGLVDSGYGDEALTTLLRMIEDHRATTVTIIAGYRDALERLFAANAGLRSRFAKVVEFPDYADDELAAIFRRLSAADGCTLAGDVPPALTAAIAALPRGPHFGNGRDVRRLYEAAKARQASRLMAAGTPNREELVTLTGADVLGDLAAPEPPSPPRRARTDDAPGYL